MTDANGTQALSAKLLEVFGKTPWPTILTTRDGRILAASEALVELCGTSMIEIGATYQTLLPATDHAQLDALVQRVCATGSADAITTQLLRNDQPALPVELSAFATPADAPQWITLTFHQPNRVAQREQLLLTFNRLVPKMLVAQSFGEVFTQVGENLLKLGINTTILLLDPGEESLIMQYNSATRTSIDLLEHETQTDLSGLKFPTTIPGYHEALTQQRTIYWEDMHAHAVASVPPTVAAFSEQLLALRGVTGLLVAPLHSRHRIRGLLVIWSYALQATDLPWIEALAFQISATLEQIELRRQMEAQIRQLDSLTATANAVTRLGALDESLHAICFQAMQLLRADCAAIHLPNNEKQFVCVGAAGLGAAQLLHMQIPFEGSLVGRVYRTGTATAVADIHQEQGTHKAAIMRSSVSSCLLQPLRHHDTILGVLVVGHLTPGYLKNDDLDFLTRYAEYAAIAVSNAQLHGALQQSEQRYRKLSEQAEADRTYLHTLINHTPDILFTIRMDMTLHVLTPGRSTALFGYDYDEFEGQTFLNFVASETHSVVLKYWQLTLAGQPQMLEMQIIKADGASIPVLISAVRVPEYDEVFIILKDMTESKRLESSVRRVESLAALGRMAAGTAHELNNPLAIVLGMTQLALLEDLPAALQHDLHSIEEAALRAAGIVEQLRAFATIQPAQSYTIALALLVGEVLDRVADRCASGRIIVLRQIAPDLPPISGNYMQLEEAFTHLCHNALQALLNTSPERARHLTVRAWPEPEWVHVTVTDTGPGITAEQLPYIFEPFYTTRPVGAGVGMGLAIVHTLVEQHGGRIWAESELGEWTTFHLTFPPMMPRSIVSSEARA